MSAGIGMRTSSMKRLKLSILIFYMALFAFLALYDERPDPELAALMAQPRPEVIEPGNAWIAFLGLTAPEGASPYADGEQRIRKLQTAIQEGKSDRDIIALSIDTPDTKKAELVLKGTMPPFSGKQGAGILAYATAHPEEAATLCRNNGELLRRYEQLRTYPRFTEPFEYGFIVPIPQFSSTRSGQRLKFLKLALQSRQGDLAGALSVVREDAEFWRFISRNSSMLISKLISIAALNNNQMFAAELAVSRQLTGYELDIVRGILRPYGPGEASFADNFRGEMRYSQNFFRSSLKNISPWYLENIVFKRNATGNRMYAKLRDYIRLSELSPRQYAAEITRKKSEKSSTPRIGIPFLYNSAGEILAAIELPQYSAYNEKGHNLEGHRRLAMLKVLVHAENIPPVQMQQFLAAKAKELGNPYTGAAMTWDSKKRSISFKSLTGEKPIEMYL